MKKQVEKTVYCGVCESTRKQKILEKIKWFFSEQMLYSLLSEKWCGNDNPPLDHKSLTIKSDGINEVIAFAEDAGRIGLGYPDKWHHTYRRKDFNKFIRWYLWQLIWYDMCGLRSFIWWKLLHRRCNKHKIIRPPK